MDVEISGWERRRDDSWFTAAGVEVNDPYPDLGGFLWVWFVSGSLPCNSWLRRREEERHILVDQ